jgi:hypothetical protein
MRRQFGDVLFVVCAIYGENSLAYVYTYHKINAYKLHNIELHNANKSFV